MNTLTAKDRKDYRHHHAALMKHIGRARNAIAELDALTNGVIPLMHHSSVRDQRELLGVAYSMALGIRLELWNPGPSDIKLLQRQAVAALYKEKFKPKI